MLRRPLLLLAVSALSTATALAQQPVPAGLDDYVASEMTKSHVPGLAVAVVRNRSVIFAKGYGMANVELRVPVTPQTIFQSGSIGKQFTATAVMMLAESGKHHHRGRGE